MTAVALDQAKTADVTAAKTQAKQEPWSGGDVAVTLALMAIGGYAALVFLAVLFGGIFASLVAGAR